jgi:hypothetical protein
MINCLTKIFAELDCKRSKSLQLGSTLSNQLTEDDFVRLTGWFENHIAKKNLLSG